MPFIKLADGTRVNVAHITRYVPWHNSAHGASIYLVDLAETQIIVDDTPGELDALIHKAERIAAHVNALVPICRVCGCTEDRACPEGCSWAEPDLCDACDMQAMGNH